MVALLSKFRRSPGGSQPNKSSVFGNEWLPSSDLNLDAELDKLGFFHAETIDRVLIARYLSIMMSEDADPVPSLIGRFLGHRSESAEHLMKVLGMRPERAFRTLAACSPHSPADTLAALASDKSYMVAALACANPSIPVGTLELQFDLSEPAPKHAPSKMACMIANPVCPHHLVVAALTSEAADAVEAARERLGLTSRDMSIPVEF